MQRVLYIFLPTWATDRVQRRLRKQTPHASGNTTSPVILIAGLRRQQQIVAACCHQAAARGVQRGMTIAHARSLLGGATVTTHPHEPAADAAALHALAQWMVRFSPRAAPDPPDGVIIDVTGCARLYGSEQRLICSVLRALQTLHLNARAVIAPTIGNAWALARYGPTSPLIINAGEMHSSLCDLPVAALRLDDAVVLQLAEVGIQRIAQLLNVPRHELAARFHHLVLRRADQAFGRIEEVIEPLGSSAPPVVEQCFAGPTTSIEAIELTVRRLLAALSLALRSREQGVQQLELAVDRYDINLKIETFRESLTFSRPTRDPRHLWALMRPHVERLHLGRGIERVELRAARVKRLHHEQSAWMGERRDALHVTEAAAQLIDLLQSRLGEQSVLRAESVDTYIPEAAFRMRPAREAAPAAHIPPSDIYDSRPLSLPRPAQLLSQPEPVRVTMLQPEGPLISVQWRDVHHISRAIGPERIGRRWWRFPWNGERPPARDYYRTQDDTGRWLWLYRHRANGQWFIHGVW